MTWAAVTAEAVHVDESWSVGGKPHGGYLLRTAVEVALDEVHPHPLAVSAHFVSSPDHGAAGVQVERLRTGRRVASSRVRISQDDAVRAEVLVSAGTLSDAAPYWTSPVAPPVLPRVEDCPSTPAIGPTGVRVGYFEHVDLRMDPATARWATGRPPGQADVRGWMRRADEADASPLDLLVFADAMPPVTFDLGLMGWVPTLELTVHLRGLATRDGCASSSERRCCATGGSTRSASSGTAPTGSSPRPVSSRDTACPSRTRQGCPPAHVAAAGGSVRGARRGCWARPRRTSADPPRLTTRWLGSLTAITRGPGTGGAPGVPRMILTLGTRAARPSPLIAARSTPPRGMTPRPDGRARS